MMTVQCRMSGLPHTCKETPLHYFDEHCYQMISGYRRVIEAEKAWEGKKILLTIDGAAHDSEVFLNGGESGRTSLWIHSFYDGYQRSTPLWRKKYPCRESRQQGGLEYSTVWLCDRLYDIRRHLPGCLSGY